MLLSLLLIPALSNAQDALALITEEDYNRIIPHLMKEDWKESEKISRELLDRFKGDSEMSEDAGIIRYMYLKSVGGLLGEKEIDKAGALKKLKGFEGKNIITPMNMFKNEGMFNYLKLNDDGNAWWKCSANNSATIIHIFETFEVADKDMINNYQKFEGKNLRVFAIIKSIAAGGSAMPRLDVIFTETEVYDIEK